MRNDPAFAREPVVYDSIQERLVYARASEADCELIYTVDTFEVDGIVYKRGGETGERTPRMMISFKKTPNSEDCYCDNSAWFYEHDYTASELEDLEYI